MIMSAHYGVAPGVTGTKQWRNVYLTLYYPYLYDPADSVNTPIEPSSFELSSNPAPGLINYFLAFYVDQSYQRRMVYQSTL